MAKLVVVCPDCGKMSANDAVCGGCGHEFDPKKLVVHAPQDNPRNPNRPAMSGEVETFLRVREWPGGVNPHAGKSKGGD